MSNTPKLKIRKLGEKCTVTSLSRVVSDFGPKRIRYILSIFQVGGEGRGVGGVLLNTRRGLQAVYSYRKALNESIRRKKFPVEKRTSCQMILGVMAALQNRVRTWNAKKGGMATW